MVMSWLGLHGYSGLSQPCSGLGNHLWEPGEENLAVLGAWGRHTSLQHPSIAQPHSQGKEKVA